MGALGFKPKAPDLGFTPTKPAANDLGFTPVKSSSPVDQKPLSYSEDTYRTMAERIGYKPAPIQEHLKPLVAKYAQKYGVDPKFVSSIISAESTGGANAVPSPAGALGVMQVMPDTAKAYNYSPADMADPEKNMDAGVHLLADNIKASGGDVYKAAAMYNHGSAEEFDRLPQQTKEYLGKIYSGMSAGDPVFEAKKAGVSTLKAMQAAADSAGKGPTHALSHNPITKPVTKQLAALEQHFIWQGIHTGENVLNVVDAPRRAVAGFVDAVQRHDDFRHALHDVGNAVFHPDQHEQERLMEATHKLFHVTDAASQRKVLEAKLGKPLANVVAPLALGSEDLAMQTLTDPLSLVGVAEAKLGVNVGRLAWTHAAEYAKQLGQMSHFKPYAEALGTLQEKMFQARPELNHYFTDEGKKIRIQLENRALAHEAVNHGMDKVAADSEDGTRHRILEYFAQHGTAKTRADAIKLSEGALDPAKYAKAPTGLLSVPGGIKSLITSISEHANEREEVLKELRETITKKGIAQETRHMAEKGGMLLNPKMKVDGIPYYPARLWGQAGDAMRVLSKPFSDLAKASVQFNPIPHAVKNVGQLAYLAGGPGVVPRAFYWALKSARGEAEKEVSRLQKMGAHTEYGGITSNMFDRLPGLKQWAAGSQGFMNHMEFGWRHALLEHLDKELGASNSYKQELMKGWMVNDKLGDYRNTSAFVQLFHMLGGPFVAFRLGIVPHSVGAALVENPQRFATILRTQHDVNENRLGKGNEIEFGGPIADFAKLISNPIAYFGSNATLGPAGLLLSLAQKWSGMDQQAIPEFVANMARNYLGPGDIFMQLSQIAEGHAMPKGTAKGQGYQTMTAADKLAISFLAAVGAYIHKLPTVKQENRKYKSTRKRYSR